MSAVTAIPGAPDVPMLELRGVDKSFGDGEAKSTVLHDIHLTIRRGEMLAIVGQSGSGKSTLMNVLGCLDRADRGTYLIQGQDSADCDDERLAQLRREHFGFVFQRYQLLSNLSATENVALPAIYRGIDQAQRIVRAAALLDRLGLSGRHDYRPSALSGGQQQRVSIARALMNGGNVILADEPTGALDSASGAEVMAILNELHQAGHTIVIVTHDLSIAAHAQRIIELKDGRIIDDRPASSAVTLSAPPVAMPQAGPGGQTLRWRDQVRLAWLALTRHRLRTLLAMLGIVMGITSVICMLAFGEGSREKLLAQIASYGVDATYIAPGTGITDQTASTIRSLRQGDVDAIAAQHYVAAVTPNVFTSAQARAGNKNVEVTLSGVNEQIIRVRASELLHGRMFTAADVRAGKALAVLNDKARRALFPDVANPVGARFYIKTMPATVVGVMAPGEASEEEFSSSRIWLPVTAVNSRLLGQDHFSSMTVKLKKGVIFDDIKASLEDLLTNRHRVKDFYITSYDKYIQMEKRTADLLSLMILVIAVITLIVAGVGVMNIMLVSVTERTPEIGLRMAVGARQCDIRQQFLTEAVMLCAAASVLGILLSLAVCHIAPLLLPAMPLHLSLRAVCLACTSAIVMAISFGYVPARNAARLNPIQALSHD